MRIKGIKIFSTLHAPSKRVYSLIIGSESCENVVSVEVVKKLQLATKSHLKPYKLTWINIDTEIIVNNHYLVSFFYRSKIL
jgi:hypothetical protein